MHTATVKMSAEGKATIPHPAVTICNTLWGSNLTFSPFSVAAGATGDAAKPVSFERLFPEEQSLVETCREAGLDREPLQLCSLLLGSSSYRVREKGGRERGRWEGEKYHETSYVMDTHIKEQLFTSGTGIMFYIQGWYALIHSCIKNNSRGGRM